MESILASLPDSVKIILILALLWVFNQWWRDRRDHQKGQDMALINNTAAILRLEIQMKNLNDTLQILPKLSSDINAAHEKIRDLQTKPNNKAP